MKTASDHSPRIKIPRHVHSSSASKIGVGVLKKGKQLTRVSKSFFFSAGSIPSPCRGPMFPSWRFNIPPALGAAVLQFGKSFGNRSEKRMRRIKNVYTYSKLSLTNMILNLSRAPKITPKSNPLQFSKSSFCQLSWR